MNGYPQVKGPLLQLAMPGLQKAPLLRMGQEGLEHGVVVHSFKACRISSITDGSDDDFILCLKPVGVAHSDDFIHCLKPDGVVHSDG